MRGEKDRHRQPGAGYIQVTTVMGSRALRAFNWGINLETEKELESQARELSLECVSCG